VVGWGNFVTFSTRLQLYRSDLCKKRGVFGLVYYSNFDEIYSVRVTGVNNVCVFMFPLTRI